MTKITESNTKAQILRAYNDALSTLQKQSEVRSDPAKEVSIKHATVALGRAEGTVTKSIEGQITDLKKDFASILTDLSNSLTDEIKTFENLKIAIVNKEKDLKELFDIESQAFTLVALVNSQRDLEDKHNSEFTIRKSNALESLDEINKHITSARETWNRELKESKEATNIEKTRLQEEFNYNFARKKQADNDELNDDLSTARRNFANEIAIEKSKIDKQYEVIEDRENKLSTRENLIDELEDKVSSFPAREEQIRREVEEQVKKDEARTAAIKDNYNKREIENHKTLSDHKITLLESNLLKTESANAELAKKLDEAYAKIQSMALASVQGSQDNKMFDKISNMMDNNKNQK